MTELNLFLRFNAPSNDGNSAYSNEARSMPVFLNPKDRILAAAFLSLSWVVLQLSQTTVTKQLIDRQEVLDLIDARVKGLLNIMHPAYWVSIRLQELSSLYSLVSELPEQDGWQPIETAPHDIDVVVGHPSYDSFPVAKFMLVPGEDENGESGHWFMWTTNDESKTLK